MLVGGSVVYQGRRSLQQATAPPDVEAQLAIYSPDSLAPAVLDAVNKSSFAVDLLGEIKVAAAQLGASSTFASVSVRIIGAYILSSSPTTFASAVAVTDSSNQSSTSVLGVGAIAGIVLAALVFVALLSASCYSLGRRSEEAKNLTPVFQTTIRTIASSDTEPENARFYRNPNSFNPIMGDARLPSSTVEWAGRGLRTPETKLDGGPVPQKPPCNI